VPRLRPAIRSKAPSLEAEQRWWDAGYETVVGVDEVGRGAWAGPLTVGAVIVPQDRRIYKIRDSKMLTEEEREALFDRIIEWVADWGVGHATPEECDRLGMSAAQKLAAARALAALQSPPGRVLVDGNWDFVGRGTTERIIRGDATSLSIAAASIIAKVTRDRMMRDESAHFPAYRFESNKGYPCPVHTAALQVLGPSTIHRRSWAFMDGLPWPGVRRHRRDEAQGRLFD
jgi:ribonuclease HII